MSGSCSARAPSSSRCHPLPRAATPRGSLAPAGLFPEQQVCRNRQCQKCLLGVKIRGLGLVGNISLRFKLIQSSII